MKAKPAIRARSAAKKPGGPTPAPDHSEAEPRIRPETRGFYVAVAALVAVVLLCYLNSLWNGFVFDDHGHTLKNKLLRSIENLPRLVAGGYRPLRDVSYALDFEIWGERPFGFHLTNVLIHTANTVLVFVLIRRFIGQTLPAALAAALFAVDPLQVDSVTYISGRRDVLFAFFYLTSFLSYLDYRKNLAERHGAKPDRAKAGLYFSLFIVCWVLSLMSKEMAASLPLFIFCWNFCDVWDTGVASPARRFLSALRKAFSRDRWLYLALSAGALAYTWFMVFVEGASSRARATGFNYWGGSFYTNLLTSIRVHAWYLKQLIFPTPMVQYSGAFEVASSLGDWRVIVSLLVVVGVLAAGFAMLGRDRLIAFAILSFFVLLLPVSQIIPHHELLADHYLYLPLMSFALLVALTAKELAARIGSRVVYPTLCGLVLVLGVMTVLRNRVYTDDLTLWQANYQEAPSSTRAVSSLAGYYATSYPARAAELYKRCIALEPSFAPAYVSLASLYQTKEKAREVEDLARRALELPDSKVTSPGYEDPRRFRSEVTMALGIARGFEGDGEGAAKLLREAIELYPANSQPYVLLAGYYHTLDPSKEMEVRKEQLEGHPYDYDALHSVSSRLVEEKKYDEAIPYLGRILALIPNDFYANYQMGQIQRRKKVCADASAYLTTARSAASGSEEIKAAEDALKGLQQECPQ